MTSLFRMIEEISQTATNNLGCTPRNPNVDFGDVRIHPEQIKNYEATFII